MTATTKALVAILDAQIAVDAPLDTVLLTAIRDSLVNIDERLGGSYSKTTKDHTHDGIDSAKVQVGGNMLRNGDFESGLTGWTGTAYTGGTIAASTLDADGTAAVQITSSVLANGGGDILSNEFMVCIGGASYNWSVNNWASVANISSKLEAVFYDAAQAHISDSVLLTSTNTPTSNTRTCSAVAVPATARYMKIRATGGIPASGSAVGTIYFDAIQLTFSGTQALPDVANLAVIKSNHASAIGFWYEISATQATAAMVEYFNARINVAGTYRVAFSMLAGSVQCYGQVYKNGVAYGTYRTNASGVYVEYTEDLIFVAGDTVQIYLSAYNNGLVVTGKNFSFRILNVVSNNLVPPSQLQIGLR